MRSRRWRTTGPGCVTRTDGLDAGGPGGTGGTVGGFFFFFPPPPPSRGGEGGGAAGSPAGGKSGSGGPGNGGSNAGAPGGNAGAAGVGGGAGIVTGSGTGGSAGGVGGGFGGGGGGCSRSVLEVDRREVLRVDRLSQPVRESGNAGSSAGASGGSKRYCGTDGPSPGVAVQLRRRSVWGGPQPAGPAVVICRRGPLLTTTWKLAFGYAAPVAAGMALAGMPFLREIHLFENVPAFDGVVSASSDHEYPASFVWLRGHVSPHAVWNVLTCRLDVSPTFPGARHTGRRCGSPVQTMLGSP